MRNKLSDLARRTVQSGRNFAASCGAIGMLVAGSAHAGQYDSLTAAVSFTDVIAALMLVAAALAGVYIAWKGASLILNALRGR